MEEEDDEDSSSSEEESDSQRKHNKKHNKKHNNKKHNKKHNNNNDDDDENNNNNNENNNFNDDDDDVALRVVTQRLHTRQGQEGREKKGPEEEEEGPTRKRKKGERRTPRQQQSKQQSKQKERKTTAVEVANDHDKDDHEDDQDGVPTWVRPEIPLLPQSKPLRLPIFFDAVTDVHRSRWWVAGAFLVLFSYIFLLIFSGILRNVQVSSGSVHALSAVFLPAPQAILGEKLGSIVDAATPVRVHAVDASGLAVKAGTVITARVLSVSVSATDLPLVSPISTSSSSSSSSPQELFVDCTRTAGEQSSLASAGVLHEMCCGANALRGSEAETREDGDAQFDGLSVVNGVQGTYRLEFSPKDAPALKIVAPVALRTRVAQVVMLDNPNNPNSSPLPANVTPGTDIELAVLVRDAGGNGLEGKRVWAFAPGFASGNPLFDFVPPLDDSPNAQAWLPDARAPRFVSFGGPRRVAVTNASGVARLRFHIAGSNFDRLYITPVCDGVSSLSTAQRAALLMPQFRAQELLTQPIVLRSPVANVSVPTSAVTRSTGLAARVVVTDSAGTGVPGRQVVARVASLNGAELPYFDPPPRSANDPSPPVKQLVNAVSGTTDASGVAVFSGLAFSSGGAAGNYTVEYWCDGVASSPSASIIANVGAADVQQVQLFWGGATSRNTNLVIEAGASLSVLPTVLVLNSKSQAVPRKLPVLELRDATTGATIAGALRYALAETGADGFSLSNALSVIEPVVAGNTSLTRSLVARVDGAVSNVLDFTLVEAKSDSGKAQCPFLLTLQIPATVAIGEPFTFYVAASPAPPALAGGGVWSVLLRTATGSSSRATLASADFGGNLTAAGNASFTASFLTGFSGSAVLSAIAFPVGGAASSSSVVCASAAWPVATVNPRVSCKARASVFAITPFSGGLQASYQFLDARGRVVPPATLQSPEAVSIPVATPEWLSLGFPFLFDPVFTQCASNATHVNCDFALSAANNIFIYYQSGVHQTGVFVAGIPSDEAPSITQTGLTLLHAQNDTFGSVLTAEAVFGSALSSTAVTGHVYGAAFGQVVFMCLANATSNELVPYLEATLISNFVSDASSVPALIPLEGYFQTGDLNAFAGCAFGFGIDPALPLDMTTGGLFFASLVGAKQGQYSVVFVSAPGDPAFESATVAAQALDVDARFTVELEGEASTVVPLSSPLSKPISTRQQFCTGPPSREVCSPLPRTVTGVSAVSEDAQDQSADLSDFVDTGSVMTALEFVRASLDTTYRVTVSSPGSQSSAETRIKVTSRVGSVQVSPLKEARVTVGEAFPVECSALHESGASMNGVELEVELFSESGAEGNILASTSLNLTDASGRAAFQAIIERSDTAVASYRLRCRATQHNVYSDLSVDVLSVNNAVEVVRIVELPQGLVSDSNTLGSVFIVPTDEDVAEDETDLDVLRVTPPRICAVDSSRRPLVGKTVGVRTEKTSDLVFRWGGSTSRTTLTDAFGCATLTGFHLTDGTSGDYKFVFSVAGIDSESTNLINVVNEEKPSAAGLSQFKELVVSRMFLALPFFFANSMLISEGVSILFTILSLGANALIAYWSVEAIRGPAERGAVNDPFFMTVNIVVALAIISTIIPVFVVVIGFIRARRKTGERMAAAWFDGDRRAVSFYNHTKLLLTGRNPTTGADRPPRDPVSGAVLDDSCPAPVKPWDGRFAKFKSWVARKRWQPRDSFYFLNGAESIWFPTRLLASAVLSGLVTIYCFLAILLFAQLVNREVDYVFDAARQELRTAEVSRAIAQANAQGVDQAKILSAAEKTGNIGGVLELLPSWAVELNSDKGEEIVEEFKSHVLGSAVVSAILCTIFVAVVWFFIFNSYKARVFAYRRGEYEDPAFKTSPGIIPSTAFIGTQVFHTALSFLLLGVLVWFVALGVSYEAVRVFVWDRVRAFFGISLLFSVLQSIAMRIAAKVLVAGYVIKHRRLFTIFDFVMTFLALAGAPMKAIIRTVTAIILVFIGLIRVDVPFTAFPFLAGKDAAFKSFKAMQVADAQYNNPVVQIFCKIMVDLVENREATPRRTRAQKRWHLALLLVRNPGLVKHRRREFVVDDPVKGIAYTETDQLELYGPLLELSDGGTSESSYSDLDSSSSMSSSSSSSSSLSSASTSRRSD